MREMVEQSLKSALSIGMDIDQFWTLDYQELRLIFEAHKQREEDKIKEQAGFIYKTASLTAVFLGSAITGGKVPSFHEAFPEIFEQEIIHDNNEKAKAGMIAFMQAHNNKRRQKEVHNNGDNSG